jgi:outer membrane protein OmpA-like peptidoglycan-associated protein
MGKPFTILFTLAFIAWLIGGTIWYKKRYCDAPVSIENVAPVVAARDQINPVLFYFPFAQSRPVLMSESVASLKKTADYLNQNIDKKLVVSGLASAKEVSLNASADIGSARAEAIKSLLIDLGAPKNALEIESKQMEKLEFTNGNLINGVNFTIVDNPDARFQPINFYFSTNQSEFVETLEIEVYLANLKRFLAANPTVNLDITAYTAKGEKSKMGDKRLNFIKSLLQNKDFNLKQISLRQKTSQKPISKNKEDIKNQRLEIRMINP